MGRVDKMKMLILCPNCEEFCEVKRRNQDVDIINACSCVDEGEKSPIEWVRMILKEWDSLTVLKEPDDESIKLAS